MNTTACANQNASFFCGFTGVDPLLLILNWNIIWRNISGSIIHERRYSVYTINVDSNNGLKWVPDFNNSNNSRLVIDSVSKVYNQSSFQCIIPSTDGDSIVSTTGFLTVAGKSMHSYNYRILRIICERKGLWILQILVHSQTFSCITYFFQ